MPSSNPDRLTPKVEGINININSDIQYMLPFLAGVIVLSSFSVAVSKKKRIWESAPITPHVQGCYVAVPRCRQCVNSVCYSTYLTPQNITLSVLFFFRPKHIKQTECERESFFFFLKLLFYFGRAWGRARPNAQSRFQWIGCGWIDPIHVFSGSSLASNPGSTLLSGL